MVHFILKSAISDSIINEIFQFNVSSRLLRSCLNYVPQVYLR